MKYRKVVSYVRAGVLVGWLTGALAAQPSHGYVFFAPGGVTCCHNTSMTMQLGGGFEAVLAKGVGIGAEIGALGMRQWFGDTVMGAFSPNGYYHFNHRKEARTDPYLTGGYTLLFRSGHANLANFGGGVNYWFRSKLGASFEFRDQLNTTGTIGHFWGFRFGLTFR